MKTFHNPFHSLKYTVASLSTINFNSLEIYMYEFPPEFLPNDIGACFFCQFPRSSAKYVQMCLCVPQMTIMATMNGQDRSDTRAVFYAK